MKIINSNLFLPKILLAMTIFSACNVYSPAPFTPVLTESKGEVELTGSALVSPELVGANASVTVGITDDLAIQGNIATSNN